MQMHELLKEGPVEASAPCRIDMGGTLDLSTFFLSLRHFTPCTFNVALDMRTQVKVSSHTKGKIRISSTGFDSFEVDSAAAPFNHELGLMLATAAFYNADGVHIEIRSTSPPRSALGGSSVAVVALIWAFSKALNRAGQPMPVRSSVALLAHAIEQSVAGVPCGLQDMLAAVYGGINAWYWTSEPPPAMPFKQVAVGATAEESKKINNQLLVAYCGAPHISKDVNGRWVQQFIAGQHRHQWQAIAQCSQAFVSALTSGDTSLACDMINQEVDIRCILTPDVLDAVGRQLVAAARGHSCAARFTGAGGGGCIWAFGEPSKLDTLRPVWETILSRHRDAKILEAGIDVSGLL
jgi:D-glycero-alpha-D-manno-heptose-7-phosphate kinase